MKINTCYPGLSKKQKPEKVNHEDCGGEVMEETTKAENCGNCGHCIFCLSKCPKCGSKSVRVGLSIFMEYSNHWDDRIEMKWSPGGAHMSCNKCGWNPSLLQRPKQVRLEGEIWTLLKLPAAVAYRDGKVIPTLWATEEPQREEGIAIAQAEHHQCNCLYCSSKCPFCDSHEVRVDFKGSFEWVKEGDQCYFQWRRHRMVSLGCYACNNSVSPNILGPGQKIQGLERIIFHSGLTSELQRIRSQWGGEEWRKK